ncbi:MAG: excinuclease ABC subunit UvrB [Bacteroidales bacterium]|nr:excinuclease ABC subunit UvrB [Bacteroidales bacterium]
MKFVLTSDFVPTGDQPDAIKQLVNGLTRGDHAQVLLGVTGSGKTFTVANVIEQVQCPTLVLSHNKTLAAQLYGEFKQFFPDNAVEYFVSYYDYYQPEAFIPSSNTYIEKDLSINDEIEKLRLSTTTSLLSGRRDVIVVSSVSCLYGIGNPDDFSSNVIRIKSGMVLGRSGFLLKLVASLYNRTEVDFQRGRFRVKGDTVDVFPAYSDTAIRIVFWGDEVESILSFNPLTGQELESHDVMNIYPATIFVTNLDQLKRAIIAIQDDLVKQVTYFKECGRHLEAKRLEDRVTYDLEMMRELGYCSGIENYSRYFDGRNPGARPFCLLDFFPSDYLMVIDESHVTIPQIKAMYGGDRSRKQTLVEYGFRLPAALDNRPLTFEEFQNLSPQTIYVSATPADFELQECQGVIVEQLIRPTGLLDPVIEVRPSTNQVDDLLEEIERTTYQGNRVLVTTLTKRLAEELTRFFQKAGIRCRYIHSDVETLERVEIMRDLRLGAFDVLVGVNLLREGLDLPEVALVAILDADKEGFLRSERSLTQTAGRAARNVASKVIMYADSVTRSMQNTINETERRREKQMKYNELNGIVPTQISKSIDQSLGQSKNRNESSPKGKAYVEQPTSGFAAEQTAKQLNEHEIKLKLAELKKKLSETVLALDFLEAARVRDEMQELEMMYKSRYQ